MAEAEHLNNERRKSIEATVLDVLKASDLETATELSVRTVTADRLGIDRFDLDQKRLIRDLIESFLLSTETIATITTEEAREGDNELVQSEAVGQIDTVLGLAAAPLQEADDQSVSGGGVAESFQHNNNNSRIICELSLSRKVTVHDFRGQSLVSIRDYHQKDEKQFPKKGGMSLTSEQWLSFKNNIPAIEEAITRMQSRLRLQTAGNPSDLDVARLVADSAQANVTVNSKRMEALYNSNSIANPQESNFEGCKQVEVNSNASRTPNPLIDTHPYSVQLPLDNHISQPSGSSSKGNLHHNLPTALPPPGLMHLPIRLDGANYYLWKHQMEFSLAELKVAYVLTEACPSISATFSGTHEEMEQAKASMEKWVDDDYICRHNILTCLCDNLFNDYSRRACSAKELWEELKFVYDEDIGTKRSQVNKYVQFQIVDGVSILEQVHELQRIAHSICSSGIWIDEDFHVSFIISKLPPSWKEFRLRMMRQEFLPLHMLMHHLKLEEDAPNVKQPGKPEKPSRPGVGSKCESRVRLQSRETKKICYNCKKEGHFSKNCPERKTEVRDNGNPKENGRRSKGNWSS